MYLLNTRHSCHRLNFFFYARYCFLKCSVSELIVAKSGFSHYSQFKDNAGLESHTSTLSLLVSSSANLYIQFGPRAELIVIFVKGWEGYLRSRPNGKMLQQGFFFRILVLKLFYRGYVPTVLDFNDSYNFLSFQGVQIFPDRPS